MDMSEQALGVGDGQGSLVCCSPWCCKKVDTTEQQQDQSKEHENCNNWVQRMFILIHPAAAAKLLPASMQLHFHLRSQPHSTNTLPIHRYNHHCCFLKSHPFYSSPQTTCPRFCGLVLRLSLSSACVFHPWVLCFQETLLAPQGNSPNRLFH